MSDSENLDEVVEINDSELIIEEGKKRKLSIDTDEVLASGPDKKCREGMDDASLIVEPSECTDLDNSQTQLNENEELEKDLTDIKVNESSHLVLHATTLIEDASGQKEEDVDMFSNCESSDGDDEDYDASLVQVMKALPKQETTRRNIVDDDPEPIALDSDSSDEEDIVNTKMNESQSEEIIEDDDEEEGDTFMQLHKRIIRYSPSFFFARRLLKKSIKILSQRTNRNIKQTNDKDEKLTAEHDACETKFAATDVSELDGQTKENDMSEVIKRKKIENEKIIETTQLKTLIDENKSSLNEKVPTTDEAQAQPGSDKNLETTDKTVEEAGNQDVNMDVDHTKMDESNESEVNGLLNEILSCSVDEIMSRYIFCNADQNYSITIDEFSEQLFYCLQENKKEIENIQRIWNEKVHLKFKIREIMEKIRRHRVISDIETFGMKSGQDSQPYNLLFSSKSSTTNSENENFMRSSTKISTQSVNRLIQDVRDNVLRKDKLKTDESVGVKMKFDETFEESSSYGLSSNAFQSSNQGRQGQTIDVQSIINDFRQKNPQEIPRRGRRMKSSFSNNYLLASQLEAHNTGEKSEGSLDQNNVTKSNSSIGFPEVSLLPVNNFYKSHSPQIGQKSSLLQSILTKQPNKHLTQPNNRSSTLARLLTAPEKTFQNPTRSVLQQSSKVHNNGEITITPIAGSSRRQLIDDEENSEPPLIIDESDDFISERHNATGSDLLCQGCRRNKALFMCAGCSRQWYCSKECQELAWDDHAESCMV